MKITNTFQSKSKNERDYKQSELHRRCILLILAARERRLAV